MSYFTEGPQDLFSIGPVGHGKSVILQAPWAAELHPDHQGVVVWDPPQDRPGAWSAGGGPVGALPAVADAELLPGQAWLKTLNIPAAVPPPAGATSLAAVMGNAAGRPGACDVAWQALGDLRNALRTRPGAIDPPAAHPGPALGEGDVPDGGHR